MSFILIISVAAFMEQHFCLMEEHKSVTRLTCWQLRNDTLASVDNMSC